MIRTVEFSSGPPAGDGLGARDKCLQKFREWWGPAELRDRLVEVAPYAAEMLDGRGGGIVNADRLAEMLYESVGPHFLRNIDNDNKKRRAFLRAAMDAAIRNGDTTERNLLEAARELSRLADTLDDIVYVNATWKWCSALALELGLPPTTADKETSEKLPPTEDVEPHSPLNPLYDYQYTTGLLIRAMLDGTGRDGKGRPIKRRLIAVPTGSGKTRMVVETLIEWLNDGKPSKCERQRDSKFIVWVAQSTELCEQAVSSFKSVFETAGKRGTRLHLHRFWGKGGKPPPTDSLLGKKGVIVATIQSLGKDLGNGSGHLERLARLTSCIVIDEAHHALAPSYTEVLQKMGFNWNNRKKEISELGIVLIGLTATPFRGTGGDEERAKLARRFGAVHYPTIPYRGDDRNQRPHALVDCQASAYAGDRVRILGARSYDRDGFIRDDGYKWTIEKTRRFIDLYRKAGDDSTAAGDEWTYKGSKNIVHEFGETGEYKVTLTVTDNEGDTGSASSYIRIAEAPGGTGTGADDTHRQKDLYENLIRRKILCEVYHHVLDSEAIELSASDVKYMGKFGEFRKDTVKGIGRNPARNRMILDEIHRMKRMHGRTKILFFGCSVEHSRQIALMLKMLYGMKTAYVDSKTDSDARSAAIESFRSGDLEVLCNFDVLTAGFDAPNIDCVFVGRPIRSTLLYTQMIGRGMRGTKSGGTEDVVLIDIDDNFQLAYGQDESLAKVGWMVYSEYWKTWDGGAAVAGADAQHGPKSDARLVLSCTQCGKTAAGRGAILHAFGLRLPDARHAAWAETDAGKPILCKECSGATSEAEHTEAEHTEAEHTGAVPADRELAQRPHPDGPHSASLIDDEFDFLRDKVCGHVPTSRQFAVRAHPDAVAAVDRLYGGYGGYLKSKGLSVRGDPFLEDALYDNYFALHAQRKRAPSAADLDDGGGKYASEEYAECFGSYERFQAMADEIIGRMSNLDAGVAKADLFRDYRRMRGELGRRPHFGEVRLLSHAGVEYYLGLFGSMADFGSAEEYDRAAALQDLESDYRRLRDLLGVAPSARQMADQTRSAALLRNLYPDMDEDYAHSEFVRDAGVSETRA